MVAGSRFTDVVTPVCSTSLGLGFRGVLGFRVFGLYSLGFRAAASEEDL